MMTRVMDRMHQYTKFGDMRTSRHRFTINLTIFQSNRSKSLVQLTSPPDQAVLYTATSQFLALINQ